MNPAKNTRRLAMAGAERGGGGGVTSDMFGAKRYNTSEQSKDRSQISHIKFDVQPKYLYFFFLY